MVCNQRISIAVICRFFRVGVRCGQCVFHQTCKRWLKTCQLLQLTGQQRKRGIRGGTQLPVIHVGITHHGCIRLGPADQVPFHTLAGLFQRIAELDLLLKNPAESIFRNQTLLFRRQVVEPQLFQHLVVNVRGSLGAIPLQQGLHGRIIPQRGLDFLIQLGQLIIKGLLRMLQCLPDAAARLFRFWLGFRRASLFRRFGEPAEKRSAFFRLGSSGFSWFRRLVIPPVRLFQQLRIDRNRAPGKLLEQRLGLLVEFLPGHIQPGKHQIAQSTGFFDPDPGLVVFHILRIFHALLNLVHDFDYRSPFPASAGFFFCLLRRRIAVYQGGQTQLFFLKTEHKTCGHRKILAFLKTQKMAQQSHFFMCIGTNLLCNFNIT